MMNSKQGERLNKMLRIIGYIISGVVVWFYTTKWILYFLPPPIDAADTLAAYMFIGICGPVLSFFIISACYCLYTWINTGEEKTMFDVWEDKKEGGR
ncbi:MAG TPA: hypothetical protein ENH85_12060 [Candidatus Scalindua sp.]|nr:hypothetical protein [Candidatus Scalindua sp.]